MLGLMLVFARHPTVSCGAERSHLPPLDAAGVAKSRPAAGNCHDTPFCAAYSYPSIALNQWLMIAMPDPHPFRSFRNGTGEARNSEVPEAFVACLGPR